MTESEFIERYQALCREAGMFVSSEEDGTPFVASAPLEDHLRRLKSGALDPH